MKDVPRDDIFKLSASAAASDFCEWVQAGFDIYIPHHNYQVKPHSSPWFPAACTAAIVYSYHFFHLYQQNKSSESKVKFRQASNCCKKVLEAAKLPNLLVYATKTKEAITSQRLGSWDFWQIANTVLNKNKYAIPPLFISPEVLQNCSLKTFVITLILMTQVLEVFCSRSNLKLHISITPKMVKKVITNPDSLNTSGPDCISLVLLKNCQPELSYILAEIFNVCLKESCFPDCWKVSLVALYLRMLGKGLMLKTTTLLVFFHG